MEVGDLDGLGLDQLPLALPPGDRVGHRGGGQLVARVDAVLAAGELLEARVLRRLHLLEADHLQVVVVDDLHGPVHPGEAVGVLRVTAAGLGVPVAEQVERAHPHLGGGVRRLGERRGGRPQATRSRVARRDRAGPDAVSTAAAAARPATSRTACDRDGRRREGARRSERTVGEKARGKFLHGGGGGKVHTGHAGHSRNTLSRVRGETGGVSNRYLIVTKRLRVSPWPVGARPSAGRPRQARAPRSVRRAHPASMTRHTGGPAASTAWTRERQQQRGEARRPPHRHHEVRHQLRAVGPHGEPGGPRGRRRALPRRHVRAPGEGGAGRLPEPVVAASATDAGTRSPTRRTRSPARPASSRWSS